MSNVKGYDFAVDRLTPVSAELDPPPRPTTRTVGGRELRKRPQRRAGRPVLDPDVISEQALRLLTEDGIDAVTMSRVARDLGDC